MPTIARDPIDAMAQSQGTMVGIGLTMEVIYQNYIVYDLALEMAWKKVPMILKEWLPEFAHRRYNSKDRNLIAAWKVLGASAYSVTKGFGGVTKSVVTLRPRWNIEAEGFMPTKIAYDDKALIKSWQLFLSSINSIGHNDVFQHDLVVVTRQVLSDFILKAFIQLQEIYDRNDGPADDVCGQGNFILEIILDLDRILATNTNFLVGIWTADAKKLSKRIENDNIVIGTKGGDYSDYYEYQARNQITRWGDRGNNNSNVLNDYAGKQWAGLVKGYYYPRWKIFMTEVCQSKSRHRSFDKEAIREKTEAFELEWQIKTTPTYAVNPVGHTCQLSSELYHKYGTKILFSAIQSSDLISIQ